MHTYRLPLHLHIYDAPVMFELPKKQIHLAGKSVFRWNQSVFKRVCFLFKEMSAVMCGSPHPSFIPVSMFVYLFVSACWEKAIIRFKQHKVSQPAEIQLCSSLCTDPPPPTSLSPLLGLQQDLMWLLSSQPLFHRWPWPPRFSSCQPPLGLRHVQLHFSADICRYANMNSWLISADINVLFPYGPPLH